jgi:hypothetical protein
MTQEERVKKIKKKVHYLVNEAMELLEANYDMENVDMDNSAYKIVLDLYGGLVEIDCLNEDGLKIED